MLLVHNVGYSLALSRNSVSPTHGMVHCRYYGGYTLGLMVPLFQVYRTLVRAGLQVCLQTSETQLSELEKSVIYDSNDYRAAYLQVGGSGLVL